jgi:predicted hydrocarbon binding protein
MLDNSKAIVEFEQSAECSSYDRASTPHSQFIRGTYSGFFSGFFGKHVDADEVRCVAKGDVACEFVPNPR